MRLRQTHTVQLDNMHLPIEEWIDQYPFNEECCFLCLCSLDNKNRTKEHIVPAWVQDRFDLNDQQLTLPNETSIPYRQTVIPCCKVCNTGRLAQLESEVSAAVVGGYDKFSELPDRKVYQWLQCLHFKFQFLGLRLPKDRRDPKGVTITDRDNLEQLRLSHFFLRSIDSNITFRNFLPGSIYVVRTKASRDQTLNFDYCDDIPHRCISVRMGEVGIIAALGDGGSHDAFGRPLYTERLLSKEFHPTQFRELYARILWDLTGFHDPFSYLIAGSSTGEIDVYQVLNKGPFIADGDIYHSYDQTLLRSLVATALEKEEEELILPDGSLGSSFSDENGNWQNIPFD